MTLLEKVLLGFLALVVIYLMGSCAINIMNAVKLA